MRNISTFIRRPFLRLSALQNFIFLLFATALVLMPFFARSAEAEEKVVRVGCFDYGQVMINITNNTVNRSGYTYEYLQEISVHTGWHYEYVPGTFQEVMDKLYRGEIDIVPMISCTEERQQHILYPDQPLGMEYFFIVSTPDRSDEFRDADRSLQGKKIGVDAGYAENKFLYDYLREHSVTAEVISYPTTTEKCQALRDKKVDAVLYSGNTMPQDLMIIQSMGAMPCYIGIAPNRPDILSEMNAAIISIDLSRPGFISYLMGKHFFNTPMNRQLSLAEIDWLKQHPVIKIGSLSDNFPYSYRDKDGTVKGVNIEAVRLMLERLNISNQVEWVLFSDQQQARKALQDKTVDLIFPEYYNYQAPDEHDILLSQNITNLTLGILCKEPPDKNGAHSIATAEPAFTSQYINANYPNSVIVPAKGIDDCVEKVYRGEATAAIAPLSMLEQAISQTDDKSEYKIIPLSTSFDVCFAGLRDTNLLLKIINRGIHFIHKDEMDYLTMQFILQNRKPPSSADFFRQHPEYPVAAILLLSSLILTAYALRQSSRSEKKLSLANAQIQDTNAHLESLVAERTVALEKALSQAEKASKSKTTFLFNMSHDIRTPMNAILGFNKMAEKHIDDKEQVLDCLGKVENAGQHLLSLINDVLEMARIENGLLEIEEKPVNLLNGKGATAAMADALAEAKHITFTKKYPSLDKDLYLWLDTVRIDQVLLNILSNAIKYTPDGGHVDYTVELLPADDTNHVRLRFTVADNGIGMSKEFLETVFDSFSRERSSTVSGIQGTGLGMAITKRILNAMHGTIEVTSELGKGTTVRFELTPRIVSQEMTGSLSPTAATEDISFKNLRVLLVEDNELNREIAKEILTDFGISVDEAEDGTIAVDKLTKAAPGQYDIVLMDIQMPIMDGYRATAEIRRLPDPAIANIPIIAMTANAFAEDKMKAMEAGMNDHLAKPIDIAKLKEALAKYAKQTK